MEKPKQDLICILRSVVCQDGTPVPADADWQELWKLAQSNHLETIVYHAASLHAPSDIAERFKNTALRMTVRAVRQGHLLDLIVQALRAEDVPFAPQKGSILKKDYPAEEFRFMSDMDLYIRPEDRKKIRSVMESIGGAFTGKESGDEQFVFPGNLGVEFHGRLLYRKAAGGIENYPDWACVDEQSNRLTEEGYALNLIGHAVSDLSKGGPGIRYILDLWVYRHRHHPQPDWDAVWKRFEKDGIDRAARNLLDLSEYLFGAGQETELLNEMAEYILAGGLYGNAGRRASSEAARAGGKRMTLFRQVFRNRTEFENRYPWLKKYPFLLPAAWVFRISRSFAKNFGTIRTWQQNMKTVNEEEIFQQKETLTRFGL